jgi:hypothetical protein
MAAGRTAPERFPLRRCAGRAADQQRCGDAGCRPSPRLWEDETVSPLIDSDSSWSSSVCTCMVGRSAVIRVRGDLAASSCISISGIVMHRPGTDRALRRRWLPGPSDQLNSREERGRRAKVQRDQPSTIHHTSFLARSVRGVSCLPGARPGGCATLECEGSCSCRDRIQGATVARSLRIRPSCSPATPS